jgi:hypothetical protein
MCIGTNFVSLTETQPGGVQVIISRVTPPGMTEVLLQLGGVHVIVSQVTALRYYCSLEEFMFSSVEL